MSFVSGKKNKKIKKLKFQSLEHRMVFESSGIGSVDDGLNSDGSVLNDMPVRGLGGLEKAEPSVTWGEKAGIAGNNEGVALFPKIDFMQESVVKIDITGLSNSRDHLLVGSTSLEAYKLHGFRINRNSTTGVYTIIGSGVGKAAWESLLRSLKFNHDSDNPTASSDTRTIRLEAKDSRGTVVERHHVTITLTPDDDATKWSAETNRLTVTKSGVAPQDIFTLVTMSDPDDTALASVIIEIKNPQTGDELVLPTNRGGVAGSLNASKQKVTFTGRATFAVYESVLKKLKFKSGSKDAVTRTIEVELRKAAETPGKKHSFSLSLNKEPSIQGLSEVTWRAAESGLDGKILVFLNAMLDSDDKIKSVTISIDKPLAGDVFSIEGKMPTSIIKEPSQAQDRITFRGVDTATQYQEILRKVEYKNTRPVAAVRTVKVEIEDEYGLKKEEKVSLSIEPQVIWTEKLNRQGENESVELFTKMYFTQELVHSIKISGLLNEDCLLIRVGAGSFIPLEAYKTNGFTITKDVSTGVYTIRGSDVGKAAWESLLRSVRFNHQGDDPTSSSNTRTIRVEAKDVEHKVVGLYSVFVTLTPSDDLPLWVPMLNRLIVTKRGVAPQDIFSSFFIGDRDDLNLDSVTIQVKNADDSDEFIVPDSLKQEGLNISQDTRSPHILVLSGSKLFSVYKAVLEKLQFKSASTSSTTRKIEFELRTESMKSGSKYIVSLFLNEEPSIEVIVDITHAKSDAPISILPHGRLISDDKIQSLTISMINGVSTDVLSIEGSLPNGITKKITLDKNEIILSGVKEANIYQSILNKIKYHSTKYLQEGRTIKVTIKDEYGLEKIETISVGFEPTVLWQEKKDKIGNNEPIGLFYDAMKFAEGTIVTVDIIGLLEGDILLLTKLENTKFGGYQDLVKISENDYEGGQIFVTKDVSKNIYTLRGINASKKSWDHFLRPISFNHEGDNPGVNRNITLVGKGAHGDTIFTYTVIVKMKAEDDPTRWGAITNRLQMRESGVAEQNIFSLVSITDPDDTHLASVIVTIKNSQTGDELVLPANVEGVTGSLNASKQKVTFTGRATFSVYQALLQELQFKSNSTNADTRKIEVELRKVAERLGKKHFVDLDFNKGLFMNGVNDVTWRAADDKILLLPGAKLISDNKIESVKISIDEPLSGDVLSVKGSLPNNIKQRIDEAKQEITFEGVDTKAEYEKILGNVEYKNTSPVAAVRTVKVEIKDQHGVTKEEEFSLRVEPRVTWSEQANKVGGNTPVLLLSGMHLGQGMVDTIKILGLSDPLDRLLISMPSGDVFLKNYSDDRFRVKRDSTGMYTIRGTNATKANWQDFLRNLKFNHQGDDPTGTSNTRTIRIYAKDRTDSLVGEYGVLVSLTPDDDLMLWGSVTNRLTMRESGVAEQNIFSLVAMSDPDDTALASVIIEIKNPQAGDELVLPADMGSTGVRGSLNASKQKVTFTGRATFSVYKALLEGLQFKSGSTDTATRQIEVELLKTGENEGAGATHSVDLILNKEASIEGLSEVTWRASESGSDAKISLFPNATLVSDDGIESVKISIDEPLSGDVLSVKGSLPNNIKQRIDSGRIDSLKQEITFEGVDTKAEYEKILGNVEYENIDPVAAVRTVKVEIKDQHGVTKAEEFSLRVEPRVTWSEQANKVGGNTPVLLLSGMHLGQGTVNRIEISGLSDPLDHLLVSMPSGDVALENYSENGFSVERNSTTGVYTIRGSDVGKAAWESLLQSLKFNHQGDNPTGISNRRDVRIDAKNSEDKVVGRYGVLVSLTPDDDATKWEATTNRLTMRESGVAEQNIFSLVAMSDPDDTALASVIIEIKNPQAGDELVLPADMGSTGVRGSLNTSKQKVTFTGSAAFSVYKALLEGLQFKSGSTDTATRQIEVELLKTGENEGAGATHSVDLILNKEASIEGLSEVTWRASESGSDAKISLFPNATLVSDDGIESVKISIDEPLSGDVLSVKGSLPNNIKQRIDEAKQEITFEGVGTKAEYEKILGNVEYKNTSPVAAVRTVKVEIKDQHGVTKAEEFSLRVEPRVTWSEQANKVGGNTPVLLLSGMHLGQGTVNRIEISGLSDPLDHLLVSMPSGDVALENYSENGFSVERNSTTGVYTIRGSDVGKAAWESLLQSLKFNHQGDNPTGISNRRDVRIDAKNSEDKVVGRYGVLVSLTPDDDATKWEATTNRLTMRESGVAEQNIFSLVAMSDPDDTALASVIIEIKNPQAGDELVLPADMGSTGVRGSLNTSKQKVTFTGSAAFSVYKALLEGLQFKSGSTDTATRQIEVELLKTGENEGAGATHSVDLILNKEASIEGLSEVTWRASESGSDAKISLFPNATLVSDDGIESVKISIDEPLSGDVLSVKGSLPNNIKQRIDEAKQEITFEGVGTKAEYEKILGNVEYKNTSPVAAVRTVKVEIKDQHGVTKAEEFSLRVEPRVTWSEQANKVGGNTPVLLLSGMHLGQGTVNRIEISGLSDPLDHLLVSMPSGDVALENYSENGFSVERNSTTGVYTIRGSDVGKAAWESLLQSLKFNHQGDNPTGISNRRDVRIDGKNSEDKVVGRYGVLVSLTPDDDATKWEATTNRLTVTKRGVAEQNIFSLVAMSDPDDTALASVIIEIKNPQAGDELVLPADMGSTGVRGSLNTSKQKVTFTGSAAFSVYKALLEGLQFKSGSTDTATRQIEVELLKTGENEGAGATHSVDLILNKEASIEGLSEVTWRASESGSDAKISLFPNATLVSDDGIESVKISIDEPLSGDVLSVKGSLPNNIKQRIDEAKQEITFEGVDTKAEYEKILGNVEYKNTSPVAAVRTVKVEIKDQHGVTKAEEFSLRVEPRVTWSEQANKVGGNTPVLLLSGMHLGQGTVNRIEISGLSDPLDHLLVSMPSGDVALENYSENGFSVERNSTTGVYTIRGSDVGKAAWESLLQSLKFNHQGDNPTGISNRRDVRIDGKNSEDKVVGRYGVLVSLTPDDDATKWEATTNRLTVTKRGVAEQNIFSLVAMSDPDDTALASVIIEIKNPQAGDELVLPADMGSTGVRGSLNTSKQKVTFTGSAAFSVYKALLEGLQFKSGSTDTATRQIEVELLKTGENEGAGATHSVDLILNKEASIEGLSEVTWRASESGSDAKISLFPNATLVSDDGIESVKISIDEPLSGDVLSVKGSLPNNIKQRIDEAKQEITFEGVDTKAEYEKILGNVEYKNTSPVAAVRTVKVEIKDQHGVTKAEEFSLRVEPRVTWSEQANKVGGNTPVLLLSGMHLGQGTVNRIEISGLSDPLDHLLVSMPSGDVALENYSENGFSVERNSTTGVYTIRGSDVGKAAWESLLQSLKFNHQGDNPTGISNRRDVRIDGKNSEDKVVGRYGVLVSLTPDDDATKWEATTNRLTVTKRGVAEQNIFSLVAMSDPDDTALASVIIEIKNPQAGDELVLPADMGSTGVRGSLNTSKQKVTFTGSAAFSVYKALLEGLQFKSGSTDTATRQIEVELLKTGENEGAGATHSVDLILNKEASIEGLSEVTWRASESGSDAKISLFPNATLVSDDGIESVKISIDEPLSGDVLSVKGSLPNNIKQRIDEAKQEITFEGVDTKAEYEKILGNVEYENIDPVAAVRTVKVEIKDQHGVTKAEEFSLRVEPRVTWSEQANKVGGNTPVLLLSGMHLGQGTVNRIEISGLSDPLDHLLVSMPSGDVALENYSENGFSVERNSTTGVYTIRGSDVGKAAWESLLQSLKFNHQGDNPTGISNRRDVRIDAKNSEDKVVGRYGVLVSLTPDDDATKWEATTNRLTMRESGVAEQNIFSLVAMSDPDDTALASVIIEIKNPQAGDELVLPADMGSTGVRGSLNASKQKVTFTGRATFSVYKALLEGLQFKSGSTDTATRQIEVELLKTGQNEGAGATHSVDLILNKEASKGVVSKKPEGISNFDKEKETFSDVDFSNDNIIERTVNAIAQLDIQELKNERELKNLKETFMQQEQEVVFFTLEDRLKNNDPIKVVSFKANHLIYFDIIGKSREVREYSVQSADNFLFKKISFDTFVLSIDRISKITIPVTIFVHYRNGQSIKKEFSLNTQVGKLLAIDDTNKKDVNELKKFTANFDEKMTLNVDIKTLETALGFSEDLENL